MNEPALPVRQVNMFVIIAVLNVAVFLVQLFRGQDASSPALSDLIEWGANTAPLTMTGDPWRLLTSMFLHIGLLHILLNLYLLIVFGNIVEKAFGPLRFTFVYLLSGAFGGLLSALWYAQHKAVKVAMVMGEAVRTEQLELVVSAGASGALMGIAGAYLARWLIIDGHAEDPDALKVRGPLAQTIGMTLVMGFLNTGIDNACHIGGLLAGAVLGACFALGELVDKRSGRIAVNVAVCAVSLLLLGVNLHMQPSAELLRLKADIVGELNAIKHGDVAGSPQQNEVPAADASASPIMVSR